MSRAAVFGAGAIGEAVARGLASYREMSTIWLFDNEERRLEVAAADAAAIASFRESFVDIRCAVLDLRNEDQVAEALVAARADVLVNTTTLQSPWALNALAPATLEELEAGARFGPWLPVNLVLPLKLMRARAAAGLTTTPVVNISFPDAVNAVLGRIGLAPTCGAGNSDLLVTGIKPLVAERLGVPVGEVEVRMCAHHFHVHLFTAGLEGESLSDYPFWLRVLVDGTDVTAELGPEELVAEAARRMPRGRASAASAESVVKNALRLVRDDPTLTHAPGPDGYGGGLDVRLRRAGVEVVWPDQITREAALDIHQRAQIGDGIADIGHDGAVTFTERAYHTMRDVLGYDCRTLPPAEFEPRAEELILRLRERVARDAGER